MRVWLASCSPYAILVRCRAVICDPVQWSWVLWVGTMEQVHHFDSEKGGCESPLRSRSNPLAAIPALLRRRTPSGSWISIVCSSPSALCRRVSGSSSFRRQPKSRQSSTLPCPLVTCYVAHTLVPFPSLMARVRRFIISPPTQASPIQIVARCLATVCLSKGTVRWRSYTGL